MNLLEVSGTMLFIFDFDGTLADSWPIIFSSLNRCAKEFGYKQLQSIEDLRSKNMQELLQELEIKNEDLPRIIDYVRREVTTHIADLKPFPGIVDTLNKLHKSGASLAILTTNAKHNVEKFLALHNIACIDFIYGESNLFGKAELLRDIIQKYNLDASNVVYIGDETRDTEAAQANNIRSVAVTWGFNTTQKLQEKKPTFLIHAPHELLTVADMLT
jgi:phosphoglycolate phosphatase